MRSKGRWAVGRARRLRVSRFAWSMGEDHLKGAYWRVRLLRHGTACGVVEFPLGSHGQSA